MYIILWRGKAMTDKSSNPFKNEDIVKDETATESQEKHMIN